MAGRGTEPTARDETHATRTAPGSAVRAVAAKMGRSASVNSKGPKAFTPNCASNPCLVRDSAGAGSITPALFHRTSRRVSWAAKVAAA